MLNQRTLRNAIKAKGIGLHTGKVVNMELLPSGPDTGIHFIRSDVDEAIKIPPELRMLEILAFQLH